MESQRASYRGNYDGVYGKVSKFNWSFEKDGSYSCQVSIIGLGSTIESLKINAGPVNKSGYQTGTDWFDKNDKVRRSLLHTFLYSIQYEAKQKEKRLEEEFQQEQNYTTTTTKEEANTHNY